MTSRPVPPPRSARRQWNLPVIEFLPLLNSALLGMLVWVIVAVLWEKGALEQPELWFYDRFTASLARPDVQNNRISLVLLNEKDIAAYDYPVRDGLLAQLIDKIESGHPALIGVDFYRDLPVPRDRSEDAQLTRAFTRYGNVIGIFLFGDEKNPYRIPPPPALAQDSTHFGFNDIPVDDNVVRRGFLYLPNSCDYTSFGFLLAENYLAMEKQMMPGSDGANVRVGPTTLPRFQPTDGPYVYNEHHAGYQFLLDFRGPGHFVTRSVGETLVLTDPATFKDQIVLIGIGSASSNDNFSTPIANGVQGTAIHAIVIDQILRAALQGDAPRATLNPTGKWIWALAWCALAVLVASYFSSLAYSIALLAGAAGVVLLAWSSYAHGCWVPVTMPALDFLLTAVLVKSYRAFHGERQRHKLMQLFSQHVAPDIADMLWRERDKFLDGGRPAARRLTATILFTDLHGFSTLSQQMPAQELMDWVNECLGALARHVGAHHGVINKFIGDAIMAVFGIPVARETEAEIAEDARNAVACALAMAAELHRLNEKWQAQGRQGARMRIGIHTGELMAGVLGSADRLEYTVIGDSVNISARLESVDKTNKMSGGVSEECRILISETTWLHVRDHFEIQFAGEEELKGREGLTRIYKVISARENSSK